MIKVKIKKENNIITNINISGHANYDTYGFDIVCSAVSSLCFCIANQLLLIDKTIRIEVLDNIINYTNITNNHDTQLLINTLVNGLRDISNNYPNNVVVKEEAIC